MGQRDFPEDEHRRVVSSGAAERRRVVAQATEVLVAQYGIDTEEAFDKLAAIARTEGRAIHDLAADVVEHGGL